MRDKLSQHRIDTSRSKVSGGMVTPEVDKNRAEVFRNELKRSIGASCLAAVISLAAIEQGLAADSTNPIIPRETTTIPKNGDVNPYGVAFVPDGFPATKAVAPGDILVSNFNNYTNTQGTGTTIVSISRDGTQNLFFEGTPPLGLTTALNVLKRGVVIVGNVPNNGGTAEAGSLIVLDKDGAQLPGSPLVDSMYLDGPWDSAVIDKGDSAIVFVACVLNGTVTRLELLFSGGAVTAKSKVTIAGGYLFGTSQSAFVVGPTGLAYDAGSDTLYVASTEDNKIFAVADATKTSTSNSPGTVIFSDANYLHGPLGLVLAPNGHLISSQGDAINDSSNPAQQSEIVEFTKGEGGKQGTFVSEFSIDSVLGSAFGIAIQSHDGAVIFGAVDDTMDVLTVYDLANHNPAVR